VHLRLLDASADSASLEDMARVILGIDPAKEPERAQKAATSHLRRTQWMTAKGDISWAAERIARPFDYPSDRRNRPGLIPAMRPNCVVKWLWLE